MCVFWIDGGVRGRVYGGINFTAEGWVDTGVYSRVIRGVGVCMEGAEGRMGVAGGWRDVGRG